jgi:hypothetical protein
MRLDPNPIGPRQANRTHTEVIQAEWRRANDSYRAEQQNTGAEASEAEHFDSSKSSEADREQNAIVPAKKNGRGKTQIHQNAELNERPRLKVIGNNAFEVKPY